MAERDHLLGRRRSAPTYESDYAAWLDSQVALLKADRWAEVDKANLIDEVESLGRSEFKSFVSYFEIVIAHMLKWDIQAERRSNSWIGSIAEHRTRIDHELIDSPSYKTRIDEAIERAYRPARARAARETDLPLKAFPEDCPYDWDTIAAREHVLDV